MMVITQVLPSAHFASADVLVGDCAHRHVRPRSMGLKVGDSMDCCYCEDIIDDAFVRVLDAAMKQREEIEDRSYKD